MPREKARNREQREAHQRVRAGTAVRRPLTQERHVALFRAIDNKKAFKEFGVRQLCKWELNGAMMPPLENHGVAWMDSVTLLEYASWRGRDTIIRSLLAGGADPFPAAGGECRAALVALPCEGACWLLRAVIQMRFSNALAAVNDNQVGRSATACRCDGCGECASSWTALALWPCGHRRCPECIWSAVTRGDPEALMLRCRCCHEQRSEAASPETALAALDKVCRLASTSGADHSLQFQAPTDAKVADAVRLAALRRGLVVDHSDCELVVATQHFPFQAGICLDLSGGAQVARAKARAEAKRPLEGMDWVCKVCQYPNWRRRNTCRNCSVPDGFEQEEPAGVSTTSAQGGETATAWAALEALENPAHRKAASRERWLLLPAGKQWQRLGARWQPAATEAAEQEAGDEDRQQSNKEEAKSLAPTCGCSGDSCQTAGEFRLVPIAPAVAMLAMIGWTRADRDSALLKAARTGDMMRLRALVLSGCDLEAVDECGQTAALLAAWRGRVDVLVLLRWAGADLCSTRSDGGISITDAARAACKGKTTAATANCLAVLGAAPVDREPAPAPTMDIYQTPVARVTSLIAPDANHPGAGAMYVDEAFTPEFIGSLDALYPRLTVVTSEKSDTCAVRSFHCDVDGSISRVLAPVRTRLSKRGYITRGMPDPLCMCRLWIGH